MREKGQVYISMNFRYEFQKSLTCPLLNLFNYLLRILQSGCVIRYLMIFTSVCMPSVCSGVSVPLVKAFTAGHAELSLVDVFLEDGLHTFEVIRQHHLAEDRS